MLRRKKEKEEGEEERENTTHVAWGAWQRVKWSGRVVDIVRKVLAIPKTINKTYKQKRTIKST